MSKSTIYPLFNCGAGSYSWIYFLLWVLLPPSNRPNLRVLLGDSELESPARPSLGVEFYCRSLLVGEVDYFLTSFAVFSVEGYFKFSKGTSPCASLFLFGKV